LEETDKPDVELEPPNGNEHPYALNSVKKICASMNAKLDDMPMNAR